MHCDDVAKKYFRHQIVSKFPKSKKVVNMYFLARLQKAQISIVENFNLLSKLELTPNLSRCAPLLS